MKKLLLPLLLTASLSATELPEPKDLTVQQLINALSYIKHENKELSEIFPELHEQALIAIDEPYPFKAIDILLDALKYIAERFQAYNENFYDTCFALEENTDD